MKSLEQKLAENKDELKKLSYTKPVVVDDKSGFVPLKPKADEGYIPPFKRNYKQKAYFTKLDKCKSSDIDAGVFKSKSKSTITMQKKHVVPNCHFCGVVGHIRPNCYLRLNLLLGILMFLNLFLFVTFMVSMVTFILTIIN